MCINPCNYTDYGDGDHKTADQGCVWLVGHTSVCGHRLSLRPIGCTAYAHSVCDNSAAAAAECGCAAIQVLFAFALDCGTFT